MVHGEYGTENICRPSKCGPNAITGPKRQKGGLQSPHDSVVDQVSVLKEIQYRWMVAVNSCGAELGCSMTVRNISRASGVLKKGSREVGGRLCR